MSGPHFTKRADLVAWATEEARKAKSEALKWVNRGRGWAIFSEAINRIRRVTLAHKHLED